MAEERLESCPFSEWWTIRPEACFAGGKGRYRAVPQPNEACRAFLQTIPVGLEIAN
jgi:hypothetical protein